MSSVSVVNVTSVQFRVRRAERDFRLRASGHRAAVCGLGAVTARRAGVSDDVITPSCVGVL